MRLRSPRRPDASTFAALDLTVEFARRRGDAHRDLREVPRGAVAAELAAAGLRLAHWWTDRPGDFALSLATA